MCGLLVGEPEVPTYACTPEYSSSRVQPVRSPVLKSPFTRRGLGEGETGVVDVEVTTRVAFVVDMT